MRSFSKRANSLLSWIVVRTFHMMSNAKPTATIAPMTPKTMPVVREKNIVKRTKYKSKVAMLSMNRSNAWWYLQSFSLSLSMGQAKCACVKMIIFTINTEVHWPLTSSLNTQYVFPQRHKTKTYRGCLIWEDIPVSAVHVQQAPYFRRIHKQRWSGNRSHQRRCTDVPLHFPLEAVINHYVNILIWY